MSGASAPQSLGDFAAMLVREVAQALLLARDHAPFVEVRSIRLRLGRLPDAEHPLTAAEPILSARYPLLDQGWSLELELDNRAQVKLGGVAWSEPAATRTALSLFGAHPTTTLKGVSAQWQTRLSALQVNSLAELAGLGDEHLRQSGPEHSLQVREFRAKARLLETPVPALPAGSLQTWSLHQVLRLSTAELQQRLGPGTVSASEVLRFGALLDALAIAIDSAVLRELSLGQLLGS